MEAQPLLSPLLDWLIVLLSVGLPGGGGGSHDSQLLRMVPSDAVIALEWGALDPEAPPADRFQTWLADPEIRRACAGLSQLRDQLRPASSPSHDASLIGLRDRWPAVAERLWRYPGCFYVAWEPDVGGKLIPRAAIVLNVGQRTEEARQELLTVLPAWMMMEKGQSLIPNALWRFQPVGEHFIWSLGSESADRVTAALQQPGNSPAANPALVAAVEQWDVPRPGHRLWINLPIDEWRQRNPALWERTPLSAVAELVPSWRSLSILGSDENGLTTRTVWLSSPARPVASWFVPLNGEPLRSIPRDAHYAASVGLATSEITRWLSLAASHVPKLSPTAAEDLQQRIEAELGLKLGDDVQAAFGNTWTVYSAPSTGGALGVSPVISVDVRDRTRAETVFAKAMDSLQRRVADSNSDSVTLQQEPFLDRSMTILHGWTPGGLALSPSFCLTDKHLVMALQPQTLRAHLRFLSSRGETLADRPDCTIPADARGFLLVDTPAILPTLWPLATMFGNAALNRLHNSGISADAGLIPSASAVLSGARPAFGILRQTETALVAEMRHPLSALAPALTVAAITAMAHDGARHHAPDAAPSLESPSIDLGSPSTETSSSDEPASALDAIVEPGKVEPIPTVVPPTPRRVWLSGLIRAVTPDDVEATLPPSVFDRIERGPSPEELQRREERRKARDARKMRVPR